MSAKGFKGRPSQAVIENVPLPDKIKCIICNKNLILLRYSHNQLKKYKENIHFSNELKAERPRCLTCTAIPGQELKCIHCGLHKSLEAFSKNARSKDRDRAHCKECQQRVSDQEANVQDAMKEAAIEEDYHRIGISAFNMSGLGSSLQYRSKKSSGHISSEAGTDDTGRVFIQQPLSPGGGATTSQSSTGPNVRTEHSRPGSDSHESTASTDDQSIKSTESNKGTRDVLGLDGSDRIPRSGASWRPAADRWTSQRAPKKTAEEKVKAAMERAANVPQNQQRAKDSDEDSDSSVDM